MTHIRLWPQKSSNCNRRDRIDTRVREKKRWSIVELDEIRYKQYDQYHIETFHRRVSQTFLQLVSIVVLQIRWPMFQKNHR